MASLFKSGYKKADLLVVLEEIGETVPVGSTLAKLKDLILDSDEFKKDPEFVKQILEDTAKDRKSQELLQQEKEKEAMEMEKARMTHELEMAKIQAQGREGTLQNVANSISVNAEAMNSRRKFTLPKLEFRRFGDDIKEWLPFWSQFERIDKDEDIVNEDKFQYLIQATVPGSRAREVVESFPPTSANYSKVIESLKARFGREDLLVEVYVRELLKLIISVQSKHNFSPTFMYDKLESYLRALETLGVTKDKCASILYPMVESCFPEDFLKAWNRSTTTAGKEAKERLINLMTFLKLEVEGEERIGLAMAGFGLLREEDTKVTKKKKFGMNNTGAPSTAAVLHAAPYVKEQRRGCLFCDGKHNSSDCFSAQKKSLVERQEIVKSKKGCFACLTTGHVAKCCRSFVKCLICGRKHVTLMCDSLEKVSKAASKEREGAQTETPVNDVNMTNLNQTPEVFLQTLVAKLVANGKEMNVRLLIDTASQRSYIVNNVAKSMMYAPLEEMNVAHSLFGGVTTDVRKHKKYDIRVASLRGKFSCELEVLGQDVICEKILPVNRGPWLNELKSLSIDLTDVSHTYQQVHILVGADMIGKLLTGQQKVLSNGMVATETNLGWTLMGKVPHEKRGSESLAMSVISLFVKEAEMADLWRLDLIGIKDPIEKKSKREKGLEAQEHFLQTVKVDDQGRYEVRLPWEESESFLPDNFNLAKRRLERTTVQLKAKNIYNDYEKVFESWIDEEIIEEVPSNEIDLPGNYLPHRAVIKESSTTPIRPVFDASARMKGHPSLNDCLHSGPNLIELIPDVLLRFRERYIGISSDVRRAFLQLSVAKEDRDFLRFLWWQNEESKTCKIFRHARVVFGVTSSPFLLAAVIRYHIQNDQEYDADFKKKLLQSFYVDNSLTSVDTPFEMEEFKQKSIDLMQKGSFELRSWEHSHCKDLPSEASILGLKWNKSEDTLKVNMSWLKEINMEKVTKRSILSIAHRIFDPIGYTAPVMLCPKLMLQKAWVMGVDWDEEIRDDLKKEFLLWYADLKILEEIEIPRWMQVTSENLKNCSLHTFCDASKEAYAAVVFLRIEDTDDVKMSLLSAKSRITPLKGGTIPRLELTAALVGARLAQSVIQALDWKDIKQYYWSDSTTVLAWITKAENWSVFVRNRTEEIKKLTDISSWRHVAGKMNPADLPSRGCSPKTLKSMKWWEGPAWLRKPHTSWDIATKADVSNDEEILKERSKSAVFLTNCNQSKEDNSNCDFSTDISWIFSYFSKYSKILRMVAWMLRFARNSQLKKAERNTGELKVSELVAAERRLAKLVQEMVFAPGDVERLKTISAFKDEEGLLRVKTKLTERKDDGDFVSPILLPSRHDLVDCIILDLHLKMSHAGSQVLMSKLRERFWIIKSKKAIRKALNRCMRCKRHEARPIQTVPVALPENRVRDASPFEISGVDLCGPLLLKNQSKAWVVLFTCAVYRAIHLELIQSLSTHGFFLALRRFIARRGRPKVIYSDNGTNFVGANNLFKSIDWKAIEIEASINRIQWYFSPPAAPWWGGFWEIMVKLVKTLLRKILGKSSLNYEELLSVLIDCESTVNSRPLTCVSEDSNDMIPLTPALFLGEFTESGVPDLDNIDKVSLKRRLRYQQNLRETLRKRFRDEYLGQLVMRPSKVKAHQQVVVGDIVLIENEGKKKVLWPMGRVTETYVGKDGNVRVVRLKTAFGDLVRPVRRIFPLEITVDVEPRKNDSANHPEPNSVASVQPEVGDKVFVTKSGRRIKLPSRFLE